MNQRTLVALTALSVVALFAGCSKEQPAEKAAPAPTAVPAPAIDPATAATVAGKIVFKGGKPRRAPIRMDADAACAALHKQPVMSEEVVINDNGTLRNVFVYVKTGLGDRPFPPPAQPVVLDQHGCLYSPHVIGLQVNQELQVLNSDQTTHNIHPVPSVNREWNRSQPPGADKLVEKFAREEVAIPVKCNIHPWMRSYLAVVKHPFFAVTAADGSFEIKGLPPGNYTLAAWHEKYGELTQQVTVAAKETKTVEFTFSPSGAGD